jgi:hypothetical protein
MEGDLLIAGERPSRWFTTAHRWANLNPDPWLLDPVVYRLSQTKGIQREDAFDLESGLRLPAAPNLDDEFRGEGPFYTELYLNAQGQVIGYEFYY